MRKRRFQVAIGIAISLLFLFLVLRELDWGELWGLFSRARYAYLIPAFLLLIFINLVRAYRWRLLLNGDAPLSTLWLFRLVNIGYLLNNTFPAKAGEIVRGVLVGRRAKGGIGRGLSTVLMERILDMLTVVVMLLVLIPFVALPAWASTAGLTLGSIALAAILGMLLLARFGDRGIDLLWRLVGRIPFLGSDSVRSGLTDLVQGFSVLLDLHRAPGLILFSVVIWMGYAFFNYVLMAVFRMTGLPFHAASLVLVATGLGMAIPASPGGLGVFEWAAVQALLIYGVSQSEATGYALGLHVFTMLALMALGLIGLVQEGLSLGRARELASSRDVADKVVGEEGLGAS
ncbi:MAG: lysylphosphatidylglycerol synthase transmembrane domain-containing protein [Anaerolineae bacterium]